MRGVLDLPDDATVTLKVRELRELIEGRAREAFEGVSTSEAAEITGKPERTLRRLFRSWERIQRNGGHPEVRVMRKGGTERGDLLFHRDDLRGYRDQEEEVVDPLPAATDPNDPDAIADRLLATRRKDRA